MTKVDRFSLPQSLSHTLCYHPANRPGRTMQPCWQGLRKLSVQQMPQSVPTKILRGLCQSKAGV